MSLGASVRTQLRVSGTAVSRTGVVRHEWGVLNTASAAFSLLI